jgi:hypothetical protein
MIQITRQYLPKSSRRPGAPLLLQTSQRAITIENDNGLFFEKKL